MTLSDLAIELSEEFGPVFPLNAEKRPLTANGCYDASCDPEKISELFSKAPSAALIGIATGDLIAIDIDRKGGKDGYQWSTLAELPFTRMQSTPSGGQHRFYRLPADRKLAGSLSSLYPGIDVKSDGGYVAHGPGYTWLNNDDIATLSPELCERLEHTKRATLSVQQGLTSQEIEEIRSGNWHEPMLRLVGNLVARGHDDDTIHAITDRFTEADYTVAQTRREVAPMIKGARDKDWAPREAPSRLLPILSPSEIFSAKPPEWIIEGLLPRVGVGLLNGPSGSGKTYVAVDAALAVANGSDFANNHPVKRGRVLYAAGEDRAGVARRIVAHTQQSGLSEKYIGVWRGISLADMSDVEHLQTLGEKFDFVINDTLSKATAGLDENSNRDMADAIERAYELSSLWNCFVLIVCHTGKNTDRGVRGASALVANVDTVLKVSRPARGSMVHLTIEKQKSGKEDIAVDFMLKDVEVVEPNTGEVTGDLMVVPAGVSVPVLVRRVLAAEPEITSKAVFQRVTDQLFDRCNSNVTETAVKAALSRMCKAGEAVNNGGKYSLSERGNDR